MQQICATCGTQSPDAESLYVLIGERGWRPLWQEGSLQHPAVEWFCSTCWERYKERAIKGLPSSGRILAQAAVEDEKSESKLPPREPK
jgi:hypothetical protein